MADDVERVADSVTAWRQKVAELVANPRGRNYDLRGRTTSSCVVCAALPVSPVEGQDQEALLGLTFVVTVSELENFLVRGRMDASTSLM